MGKIILVASLPLPISVNENKRFDFYNMTVVSTRAATEQKQLTLDVLKFYRSTAPADRYKFAPFAVHYVDDAEITAIHQLKEMIEAKRSKNTYLRSTVKESLVKLQARRKWYSFDLQIIYNSERPDGDNVVKPIIDVVSEWAGFNDRRVVNTTHERVVDPTVPARIEVVLRETERMGNAGTLIKSAMEEISLSYDLLGREDVQAS